MNETTIRRDNGSGFDQFPKQTTSSPQWWQEPIDFIPPVFETTGVFEPADPVEDVIEWINQKHTTLWSTFNVGPEGDTRKAAEWFHRELESFVQFLTSGGAE